MFSSFPDAVPPAAPRPQLFHRTAFAYLVRATATGRCYCLPQAPPPDWPGAVLLARLGLN